MTKCSCHTPNEFINFHSCVLVCSEGRFEHIVTLHTPQLNESIWNNEIVVRLNKDNKCVEIVETYSTTAPCIGPITNLAPTSGIDIIYACIQKMINVLSLLDERGWILLTTQKKIVTADIFCKYMINICSDGSVVLLHKYLMSTQKKGRAIHLLPHALQYFLCREKPKRSNSKPCSANCRLKRHDFYFNELPVELLHMCFCVDEDLKRKSTIIEVQIKQIIQTFENYPKY